MDKDVHVNLSLAWRYHERIWAYDIVGLYGALSLLLERNLTRFSQFISTLTLLGSYSAAKWYLPRFFLYLCLVVGSTYHNCEL